MLYVTFETDVRERFVGSQWLQYPQMAKDTPFQAGDVVVLTEWFAQTRQDTIDLIHLIRRANARVVYIGTQANQSEELNKQLVLLGVYDFFFVDKALELRLVERMIDHPKTAQDVAIYMDDFAVHTKEPELYDVLEPESKESEEVAVALNHVEQEGREEAKKRFSLRKREEKEEQRPILSPPKLKKIVWGKPEPVRIHVMGDAGSGRTWIAWNLAALCQARNWSTAIVDTDMQPLSAWAAPESCHVYTKEPTGYRVVIDLLAHEKPADLTCIVTFADALRIAHWQDVRMGQASTWIINHHGINDPMPAVDTIVDSIVLIPHDPRHVAAQFLRKPLVTLDPSFARHFDHLMQTVEHLIQVKSVGKEVEFDVGVSGV